MMNNLLKTGLRYRFQIDSHWLIILVALYFTIALNLGLWRYITHHLVITGINMFFFGVSLPILIFVALWLGFNFLVIPYLAKPLLIFLLIFSSIANYFIFNFGIFINSDMIRNVVETNTREAFDLITPGFLLWFFLGGIVPAILLLFTDIRYQSFRRECRYRLIAVASSLAITGIIAALFFKEYAAFGRNHQNLHRLINPINFIQATYRYLYLQSMVNRQLQRLDETARLIPDEDTAPSVFILVIGETARAKNFSLNGYPRQTNPQLSKENVISFKNVYSCGTATAISVPCIFSNMTRKQFNVNNAKYSENLIDLIQQTGFQVLWRDNDDGCKGVCNRVPHEDMVKSGDPRYCDGQTCFDEVLVENLEDYLANIKTDAFIVLHTIGSHGPTYYKRYPDSFRKFTPTCDTAEIQKCTREEIINTYDNTILYTDYVVSRAINILKKFPHIESGLLYVSDHGESLGENNIYLHGLPYSVAPEEQIKVPMILWMSKTMTKFDHLDYSCIAKKAEENTWSHDNIFHTLLALLEIKSTTYDRSLDIFDHCRLKPFP